MNGNRRSSAGTFNFFKNLSITNWIVLINVVVYILVSLFVPASIIQNDIAVSAQNVFQGRIWTVLTSVFMHASVFHLLVNMISLMFIGNFIERIVGRKRLLWFYLIAGIVASFAYIGIALLFNQPLDVPAVGASGAIFGLGGMLMILTPRLPVLVFFVIPMPMWIAMIFMLVVLWVASLGFGLPIGNTAHLGGLIIGIIYGYYLKNKYKKKVALLNRYFS